MYINIYTYSHIYMHMYTDIYIYVYICTYIRIIYATHMYVYTYPTREAVAMHIFLHLPFFILK